MSLVAVEGEGALSLVVSAVAKEEKAAVVVWRWSGAGRWVYRYTTTRDLVSCRFLQPRSLITTVREDDGAILFAYKYLLC